MTVRCVFVENSHSVVVNLGDLSCNKVGTLYVMEGVDVEILIKSVQLFIIARTTMGLLSE